MEWLRCWYDAHVRSRTRPWSPPPLSMEVPTRGEVEATQRMIEDTRRVLDPERGR